MAQTDLDSPLGLRPVGDAYGDLRQAAGSHRPNGNLQAVAATLVNAVAGGPSEVAGDSAIAIDYVQSAIEAPGGKRQEASRESRSREHDQARQGNDFGSLPACPPPRT